MPPAEKMPAVATYTASRENDGHWYVVQSSNNPAPTSAAANHFLAADLVDYLKNALRKDEEPFPTPTP
jgi:hypothetical protein